MEDSSEDYTNSSFFSTGRKAAMKVSSGMRAAISRRSGGMRMMSFDVKEHIRMAQANEIFRSSFIRSSKSDTTISPQDLDDLVRMNRVRPSLLVDVLEVSGQGLGLMTRYSPPVVKDMISKAVVDASAEQFNDSIRELAENKEAVRCEYTKGQILELKETLKYHRDCEFDEDDEELEGEKKEKSELVSTVGGVISKTLFNVLKVTKVI